MRSASSLTTPEVSPKGGENMASDDLLLLKGSDIVHLLHQQETAILKAVQHAYQTHARGLTAMPADSYLRFPGMEKDRIISKVAYLGGGFNTAGIKWIASFPGNVAKGMERASATLILNSIETGRPIALMESSVISAKRTAASAVLGAQQLWPHDHVSSVGLVGCGLINFETLRFLLAVYPMIETVHLYDLNADRAAQFCDRAQSLKAGLGCVLADGLPAVLEHAPILSLATTAVSPHITSLAGHQAQAVLLHISLRDFSAELMLQADNVVDDLDKASSNNTSLHLAEQQVGHRAFIRTTIGDILNGDAPPRDSSKPFAMYSPFGLGILDLAVADLAYQLAQTQDVGTNIEGFLPPSWLER